MSTALFYYTLNQFYHLTQNSCDTSDLIFLYVKSSPKENYYRHFGGYRHYISECIWRMGIFQTQHGMRYIKKCFVFDCFLHTFWESTFVRLCWGEHNTIKKEGGINKHDKFRKRCKTFMLLLISFLKTKNKKR